MKRPIQQTPAMRSEFKENRHPLMARQDADLIKTEAERRRESEGIPESKEARRSSFMVKRQQNRPVLRPAPHIANGPDRAAFNTAWEQERNDAANHNKQTIEDRKAAFMKARQAPEKSKTRNHNR